MAHIELLAWVLFLSAIINITLLFHLIKALDENLRLRTKASWLYRGWLG